MRPNNPKETLKSLEETRATLKAQLCAVEFYIGHLKTNVINVIHVRSPFAQRPVTRAQSSSNARGSKGTVNTVNTAEASSPSISDDETAPSETSFEETETDTSFVTVKEKSFSSYSFTQKLGLRPRGSRGKDSTTIRKAKYEAKKEERNKTLIPQQSATVSSSQQQSAAVSSSQQQSAAVSSGQHDCCGSEKR